MVEGNPRKPRAWLWVCRNKTEGMVTGNPRKPGAWLRVIRENPEHGYG